MIEQSDANKYKRKFYFGVPVGLGVTIAASK